MRHLVMLASLLLNFPISASEISSPDVKRSASQAIVQFNSKSQGTYRIVNSNGVLCRYGEVNVGANRIHLKKMGPNESLAVQFSFGSRVNNANSIRIKSKPQFSPLKKIESSSVIYQLPLRTFLATGLGRQNTGRFRSLSSAVLKEIRELGSDYLWLTGVLQHANPSHDDPDGLKGQAGSYYAITDNWDVASDLGSLEDFDGLIKRAHKAGLRVLIDFIPNHTARVHQTDVECKQLLDFGRGDRNDTFFDPQNNYFYLGKQSGPFVPPYQMGWPGVDGVFDSDIKKPGIQPEYPTKVTGNNIISTKPPINSWFETAKLNYGYNFKTKKGNYSEVPKTWKIMLDIGKYWLSKGVDGFRFDFAHSVPLEFWAWFNRELRRYQPNAFLLAEAYETDTQMKVPKFSYENLYRAGFDSVYNSKIYWALRKQAKAPGSMYEANFNASPAGREFFRKTGSLMTHYVENHDELRVASRFYAPHLQRQGEKTRLGWSQFVYSAFLPGNILLHGGQEVGEDASVFGPYAKDNGRTSIFDYVYQSQTLKWLRGKLDDGNKKLRNAYAEVLRFKHHSPFSLKNSNRQLSFLDLLPVNSQKEQSKWVGSYLRFDKKSAFLVVTNSDPRKSHETTIHFTNVKGKDSHGALRAMNIPLSDHRHLFVEVLSRKGWMPSDPNISGTGIPGRLLYKDSGVPSGLFIGEIPPATTYVFKIVPFGKIGRRQR
ncbi:alpha-amylase family glycosyl hydrolase [Oligoflexaceae bacterium]|nr:alpha-amylase family glycosyl hydrolase [Oligoflexaceae bacterium]